MELFPAIDLKDGQVVRLTQGDYRRMDVYSGDPVAVAKGFLAQGARNLHVVDLDGAKQGAPVNGAVIEKLARCGLFMEVGGGIRNEERIREYLDMGVGRVILGTAALRDPEFLAAMAARYKKRVAVGVDARDGRVAVSGWLENSDADAYDFCRSLPERGVSTVIFTDISRDGGLKGCNLSAYRRLVAIVGLDVVASGGVSSNEEIAVLRDMGIYGAIVGKALYEGRLDLAQALKTAQGGAL